MVVGVGGNSGAMSERLMIPEQLRATRAHLESQRPAQSLTHLGARDVALALQCCRDVTESALGGYGRGATGAIEKHTRGREQRTRTWLVYVYISVLAAKEMFSYIGLVPRRKYSLQCPSDRM